MAPYWVTFKDRASVCVEANSEQGARETARMLTGCEPVTVKGLPYPAEPRIGPKSDCPSFCFTPQACQSHGSCPRPYSCTE